MLLQKETNGAVACDLVGTLFAKHFRPWGWHESFPKRFLAFGVKPAKVMTVERVSERDEKRDSKKSLDEIPQAAKTNLFLKQTKKEDIKMAQIKVTRNVTGSVDGALVRLSQDGEIATVLVRDTGLLERVPAATLSPAKGRPIKLVRGLCRADVNELIRDDAEFVQDAIVELFGRQTWDEREVKATYHDNDVGFRADDARRGSLLACKSACAWQSEDYAMARSILRAYSGTQLFDVAAERLSEREIVAATSSTETERCLASVLADLA